MKLLLEEYGTTIISGICTMTLVGVAMYMSNDLITFLTNLIERM